MELKDLDELKVGTVLKKRTRRRIYLGRQGIFVYYTTPSNPKETTGELASVFAKWLKGAKVEQEEK